MDQRYRLYIEQWKQSLVDGGRGVRARNISGHVRRYLFEKHGSAGCTLCGWKEKNVITGEIPLEIDHIDGDSENNAEINLRLICPNCHYLTANFRNLNKAEVGHGGE